MHNFLPEGTEEDGADDHEDAGEDVVEDDAGEKEVNIIITIIIIIMIIILPGEQEVDGRVLDDVAVATRRDVLSLLGEN